MGLPAEPPFLDSAGVKWHQRGTPTTQSRTASEAMKTFLLRFFTWWNSQTFGTQVWTWLYGEFVGDDEFGNRYYRTKGGKIDPTLGFERRWVIYHGITEASMVPPSLARLAAPHRGRAADRRTDQTAPLGEAASAQSHRHAGRLSPERFDLGAGAPPQGDRRLQGLDARAIK